MDKIIFSYRVVWDEGKAPCVDDGMFSLVCCMSQMRRIIAKEQLTRPDVDFYLLGLRGGQAKNSILFYAKLEQPMLIADYYRQFITRKDCLYCVDTDGSIRRNNRYACSHPWDDEKQRRADIENPEKQYALISHEFHYFGKSLIPVPENVSARFSSILAAHRSYRPASPYALLPEYEDLHKEVLRLIHESKPCNAVPYHSFPVETGCDVHIYSEQFIRSFSSYANAATMNRKINEEIENNRKYCANCTNAASVDS